MTATTPRRINSYQQRAFGRVFCLPAKINAKINAQDMLQAFDCKGKDGHLTRYPSYTFI